MAVNSGQTFSNPTDSNTAIDTILTQEANRIGQDIHRRTLHVSPWMDLIKQTSFPDGMGYTLGTLIYDRALPTTTHNGSTLGNSWIDVGGSEAASLATASTLDQILIGTKDTNIGAGSNSANGKSFISFGRQLKQYSLKRATVESPKINVEDLRFAAYRTEQLRAVMDALTDATRYSWEERYRDEYDRIVGNYVICEATGTTIVSTGKEGNQSADIDFGASTHVFVGVLRWLFPNKKGPWRGRRPPGRMLMARPTRRSQRRPCKRWRRRRCPGGISTLEHRLFLLRRYRFPTTLRHLCRCLSLAIHPCPPRSGSRARRRNRGTSASRVCTAAPMCSLRLNIAKTRARTRVAWTAASRRLRSRPGGSSCGTPTRKAPAFAGRTCFL